MTTTPNTQSPARCYREYCCNVATFEVELLDRSGSDLAPILWGWCPQHQHEAYSQRVARSQQRVAR
jgi:hypothetical protein